MPFPFVNPDPAVDAQLVIGSSEPEPAGFAQIDQEGFEDLVRSYLGSGASGADDDRGRLPSTVSVSALDGDLGDVA